MPDRNLAYAGGFESPVFQAQSTFKTLMDCLARPGIVGRLTDAANPPAPLGPGAGAIALTLCDHDTPVYLSPRLIEAGVQSWFAFQTGALAVENREEAAFAFFEVGTHIPALSTFALGTQEYPDRSTTLVVELEALEGGEPMTLAGPGIDGSVAIAPKGLPLHFASMWRDNGAAYPRGVDVILVAGLHIVGLPRTTRISFPEV